MLRRRFGRGLQDTDSYGIRREQAPPTSTARLRRSLRGAAPPQLTRRDRFDKLITHVNEKREQPVLRQFYMPSYILASAQDALTTKAAPSTLELLPTDVLLDIINKLEGNDQIMVSLSCKILASIVEASSTRKIANVRNYVHGYTRMYFSDLQAYEDHSTDTKFVERGYMRPPPKPPGHPIFDGPRPNWYNERDAAIIQVEDLKAKIALYLGSEYSWCKDCEIFRLLSIKWWQEFAEHDNPGITTWKGSAKKVKEIIADWRKTSEDIADLKPICPAHKLLEQRSNGKRVIDEPPEEKPARKGKGPKTKSGMARKLKRLEKEESDTD